MTTDFGSLVGMLGDGPDTFRRLGWGVGFGAVQRCWRVEQLVA